MYEDMTREKITEAMLDRISDRMDRREGSVIYDAVAAVSYSLADMYFRLENHMDLVFADTAAGEYLDRTALAYGLERKEAVHAVRLGIFDREIPSGSRFSTTGENVLFFIVTTCEKAENGLFVCHMQCETAGPGGNTCSGKLLPVEYVEGLSVADLGEIVVPGTDVESDDSLRERLLNKIRRPSTSGNANDYYNWAMECAGVGAARVFPLADGPGTVKVVITDSDMQAAGRSLTDAVKQHTDRLRPIGATVTVVSAAEKTVNISAKVRLNGAGLGAVQNAFRDAATGFLRQSAFSAAYISPARIGSLLMGIAGVEDYTDLRLNGAAGNITVGPEEVTVMGTVRLEVITDGNQ